MKKLPIALLLALGVSTFSYAAEPIETQIAAFKKSVTEAYAKLPIEERRNRARGYEDISYLIDQATAETANDRDAMNTIGSIVNGLKDNPEIAVAGQELVKSLREQRAAVRVKAREDLEAALAKAGAECIAATRTEDIDPVIAALLPFSRNAGSGGNSRYDSDLSERAQRAYLFVIRWQDYLDATRTGRTGDAQNIMRDLLSTVDTAMMPRSKILALMPSPASNSSGSSDGVNIVTQRNAEFAAAQIAAAIPKIEQARTSDDLIAVVRLLTTRRDPYNYSNPPAVVAVLTNVIDERQQVLAGTRTLGFNSDNNRQIQITDPAYTPAAQAALNAFRRETQLIAIQKNYPGVKLPAPASDETPDAYSSRLVDKFAADGDWLRLRDALDFQRSQVINGRAPVALTTDIDSLNAYIAARNLDAAGQFSAAVVSYQRALRSAGKHLPVQAIGERLAQLKKTHAEAFTANGNEPSDESAVNARAIREFPPGMVPNSPYSTGPSMPRLPAPTGPAKTPAPAGSN